jgi:septum formation protein
MLLREACISFAVVPQHADETVRGLQGTLAERVMEIALAKMAHVVLENGISENDHCFVLTADTLVCDVEGVIHGKPLNYEDAVAKIQKKRQGATACTAFCLEKKRWRDGKWHTEHRIIHAESVSYIFDVPDVWLSTYFARSPGLQCAGGAAVEQFGGQFLKEVHGSHSALIGLPMVQLRQALETLGFFSFKQGIE